MWKCLSCDAENPFEEAVCTECGDDRPADAVAPAAAEDKDDRYYRYRVGAVLECEPVPNKTNLKQLVVDVGAGAPLQIVTNAPNVSAGVHIVVALEGATVNDEVVKKASVGGVVSFGMICDAPMLGWVGGGAGNAALVPTDMPAGSRPPESRPRLA
jgi:tRNA-binding EMAP/Myf-like protein